MVAVDTTSFPGVARRRLGPFEPDGSVERGVTDHVLVPVVEYRFEPASVDAAGRGYHVVQELVRQPPAELLNDRALSTHLHRPLGEFGGIEPETDRIGANSEGLVEDVHRNRLYRQFILEAEYSPLRPRRAEPREVGVADRDVPSTLP